MNVIVTRAAEGFARRAWTVAEILNMVDAGIIGEDEHFELIDGEVVPMSPKGNQHEVLKSALLEHFAVHRPKHLRLAVETSLFLDERTFLEPDICLYPRRLLPRIVKGHDVLLAIEIAASSLEYDSRLKASIYAKHHVCELWIVEAETRITWVHRAPQTDGNWGSIEKVAAQMALSPLELPDITVTMAALD